MHDNLVVIAAHGSEYINECLDKLGNKYPILIVDTFSKKPLEIESRFDVWNLSIVRLPYMGFTTGAYLWAYWHFPAKNYFFMQDSMFYHEEDPDYLAPFIERLPNRGLVSWASFNQGWDDDRQYEWAKYLYEGEYIEEKSWGVWGPVFYISRESLDELRDKQLLPPTPMNKVQAQGCERLWGWAIKNAKMEHRSLCGQWDAFKMQDGEFPFFTKKFAARS
jgi:hypothetical protein